MIRKKLLFLFLMIAVQLSFGQTYDIYISNQAITSGNVMEFDVMIRNTGATASWQIRSFQCGYQLNSTFVNGGVVTGSYVSGTCDFDSSFSPVWGFRYDAGKTVMNQSANIGSKCISFSYSNKLVVSTPKRIGRFRMSNSVNWGCAGSGLAIRTSGSGTLLLAVTKFNSNNCTDQKAVDVTAGANAFASTPNSSTLAAQAIPASLSNCGENVNVVVSASGGLAPYTGIGTFSRAAGTYNFTVSDVRGCSVTTSATVVSGGCAPVLNVNVFLEGFYAGSGIMRSTLYDLGISPESNATDTVTLQLWSPAQLANSTPAYSSKAILRTNGQASISLPSIYYGKNYYLAIKHRNSFETWSANPVTIAATTNYDFTNSLSSAYSDGVNPPQKSLGAGKFGFYGGDVNQDGTADVLDMNEAFNGAAGFLFGYYASDCDGDGEVGVLDMNIIYNNSINFLFFARPY